MPGKDDNEKFDDTVKIVSFKNYYDDPFTIKKPHQWTHYKKYNTDIGYLFTHILHELDKPHDATALKRFHMMTKQIDDLRNEDLFAVIPEMNVLRDTVDGN